MSAPQSHVLNVASNHSRIGVTPEVRWESLRRVHVIGVCGTLMGAFAASLRRAGVEVTGSDQNVYPPMSDVLRDAGVTLLNGFDPTHLQHGGQKPDLVVIGNVISANNLEARAAIDGGMPYLSLPEMMERYLLPQSRNLVVAGTHGKTTTSSLLAFVLHHLDKKPSWFIGGVSHDLPESFHLEAGRGAGSPFVLEGDEYDTAFWDKVPKFNHYLPNDVILTSVEYDHADIYPDFAAVQRAFEGLVHRVRQEGAIIAYVDAESVRAYANLAKSQGLAWLTYGQSENARFRADEVAVTRDGTRFTVLDDGRAVASLEISLPGMHNVLNALAVWILCTERLGIPSESVREALKKFRGVRRRQEERGEVRGVLVIDDFAHHPTAVRETLQALALKYRGRRLVAVFEPRSATSRRKVFQADYARAFDEAAQVLIAAPYDQSKIDSANQFSSEELVENLRARGRGALVFQQVDEGVEKVVGQAREGDVIAVLSNGGFGGFIPKLLDRLGRT